MPPSLLEAIERVRVFMESGGDVLVVIFAVTFVMWTLILERFWFMSVPYRRLARQAVSRWEKQPSHSSWVGRQIRRLEISQVSEQLKQSLPMIRTLVGLCPLLGLLGTVTGMVEVFDVMALVGSGNARAMASGISKATIPTMAGMVAALSGLYFSARLEQMASERIKRLEVALDVVDTPRDGVLRPEAGRPVKL